VLQRQIPILKLAILEKQNLFFFFPFFFSFFFPPKTSTSSGKISLVLPPREEVLHLPAIQTVHLCGVDSLRVVYFPSLLFPSFTSAAQPLPQLLRKFSDGKLEPDASLRAALSPPDVRWEESTAAPALLRSGQCLERTLTIPPVTTPPAHHLCGPRASPGQEQKYSQETPPKQLNARKREWECTPPDLDLNF